MKKSREPLQIWVDNIIRAYLDSSESDKAEGLSWYPAAHTWCQDTAKRHGVKTHLVVGTVAALSPMVSWNENLRDTSALLKDRKAVVSTYLANKRKAIKILEGNNPRNNLGQFKTLSFYNCIIGSYNDVCIDRHAAAVAFGRNLSERERGRLTGVTYERVRNAYRQASRALKLIPSALQAIVWIYWRRTKVQKSILEKILLGGS